MKCSGSVELTKIAPPRVTGVAAHRGTAAHTVLEECWLTNVDPWTYLGTPYQGGEVNEEDIHAVIETMNYLDKKLKKLTKKYGELRVLKEIDISVHPVHEDLWGALDIVIYSPTLTYIGIFDYKHGSGKAVNPERNSQILIYLLGAIEHIVPNGYSIFGWGEVFENMEVGILQPRLKRKRGLEKLWDVDPQYLDEFAEDLREKAKATEGSTDYVTGGHCFWCPGQPICPLIHKKNIDQAKQEFKPIEKGDIDV